MAHSRRQEAHLVVQVGEDRHRNNDRPQEESTIHGHLRYGGVDEGGYRHGGHDHDNHALFVLRLL